MRSFSSYLTIAAFCVLTACTSAPVKVDVAKKVDIDCGPEPRVAKLVLFPIKPIAYYDEETGKAYVKITMGEYEHQSINAKRIEQHFIALGALIEHYRGCVRDFNASTT